jgi:hypothetical protein
MNTLKEISLCGNQITVAYTLVAHRSNPSDIFLTEECKLDISVSLNNSLGQQKNVNLEGILLYTFKTRFKQC